MEPDQTNIFLQLLGESALTKVVRFMMNIYIYIYIIKRKEYINYKKILYNICIYTCIFFFFFFFF